MARGRVGRPALSSDLVERGHTLRRRGFSVRRIARELVAAGQQISRASVGFIIEGKHLAPRPSTSRLAPGEYRAPRGEVCPTCGSPLAVLPCRLCRTRDLEHVVGASDRRITGVDSMRNPLAFELRGEEAQRLADLQRQRTGVASRGTQ
jgi:hypothetical protein